MFEMYGIIEDNFSAEGIEDIHFIVWIGIGILAIVGYLIYIPKKRKQERIRELEDTWPDVLADLSEELRAGMGVE